jgi:hypothetical protein
VLRNSGGIALARGGHGGLLAWGYTRGLGNLEVDIIGATDSLTGDVMLTIMLIVVVIIVIISGGRGDWRRRSSSS